MGDVTTVGDGCIVGEYVADSVGVALITTVGSVVAVSTTELVGVDVGVDVDPTVAVGELAVGGTVGRLVFEGIGVFVGSGVRENVAVAVLVAVAVEVRTAVGVTVRILVEVAVDVGVMVGVARIILKVTVREVPAVPVPLSPKNGLATTLFEPRTYVVH